MSGRQQHINLGGGDNDDLDNPDLMPIAQPNNQGDGNPLGGDPVDDEVLEHEAVIQPLLPLQGNVVQPQLGPAAPNLDMDVDNQLDLQAAARDLNRDVAAARQQNLQIFFSNLIACVAAIENVVPQAQQPAGSAAYHQINRGHITEQYLAGNAGAATAATAYLHDLLQPAVLGAIPEARRGAVANIQNLARRCYVMSDFIRAPALIDDPNNRVRRFLFHDQLNVIPQQSLVPNVIEGMLAAGDVAAVQGLRVVDNGDVSRAVTGFAGGYGDRGVNVNWPEPPVIPEPMPPPLVLHEPHPVINPLPGAFAPACNPVPPTNICSWENFLAAAQFTLRWGAPIFQIAGFLFRSTASTTANAAFCPPSSTGRYSGPLNQACSISRMEPVASQGLVDTVTHNILPYIQQLQFLAGPWGWVAFGFFKALDLVAIGCKMKRIYDEDKLIGHETDHNCLMRFLLAAFGDGRKFTTSSLIDSCGSIGIALLLLSLSSWKLGQLPNAQVLASMNYNPNYDASAANAMAAYTNLGGNLDPLSRELFANNGWSRGNYLLLQANDPTSGVSFAFMSSFLTACGIGIGRLFQTPYSLQARRNARTLETIERVETAAGIAEHGGLPHVNPPQRDGIQRTNPRFTSFVGNSSVMFQNPALGTIVIDRMNGTVGYQQSYYIEDPLQTPVGPAAPQLQLW